MHIFAMCSERQDARAEILYDLYRRKHFTTIEKKNSKTKKNKKSGSNTEQMKTIR